MALLPSLPLAAGSAWGQLAFLVVIALLSWIFRERQARTTRPTGPARDDLDDVARGPSEDDWVLGDRPLQHMPHPPEARPVRAARSRAADRPTVTGEAPPPTVEAPPEVPGSVVRTRLAETADAEAHHGAAHHRKVRAHRRLGIRPGEGREALRRAVLWHEVLGSRGGRRARSLLDRVGRR